MAGDPQILEVELAKLKVLVNDIAAHQASVDTLNDAGAQIITQGTGTCELLYAFTYHYKTKTHFKYYTKKYSIKKIPST